MRATDRENSCCLAYRAVSSVIRAEQEERHRPEKAKLRMGRKVRMIFGDAHHDTPGHPSQNHEHTAARKLKIEAFIDSSLFSSQNRIRRPQRVRSSLVNDHRSESLPDHRFGAIYHLIDDAGGAHQSLGLTNRFTGQQAHLFEVACEFRSRWKSAKPLHRKLLSIKASLTNHRKLRIRNDLVWRCGSGS
jgi:hypothetical protein